MAWATAHQKRFFHWFFEFPDVIARGGFDCILGNPPYLHGQKLSSMYGHSFCNYVRWEYAPAGLSDLVVFFVRRIFSLLKLHGYTAFISTNSIKDGDNRRDALEQVLEQGGEINMAVRAIKWPGRANLVVSLLAICKGAFCGRRALDGRDVPTISAFLEDTQDVGSPVPLLDNAKKIFQGVIFLGDGFLLTHEEAAQLIAANPQNRQVIFPVTNGQELNSKPDQKPGRSIINFQDWPKERAALFKEPFDVVLRFVRPLREKDKRQVRRERWWQYAERAAGLYNAICSMDRCFAATGTTKYLNFSLLPTNIVFLQNVYVLTTNRWDVYCVVQSTIHEVWARKYSGALETRLHYTPTDCFETFAFPEGLWQTSTPTLTAIGERYHEHRRSLMVSLWLGLTDIYNLFHARDLSPAKVAEVSKKPEGEAELGYQGLVQLRRLHRELDLAIRDAYGWQDLDLGHDFHEVETLPENDRVRYTISPAARKEVLRRLLALNHARAEAAAAPTNPRHSKKAATDGSETHDLFSGE